MKTQQQKINTAARKLSVWCKTIVDFGPCGSARYVTLDDLRKKLNQELRMNRIKKEGK